MNILNVTNDYRELEINSIRLANSGYFIPSYNHDGVCSKTLTNGFRRVKSVTYAGVLSVIANNENFDEIIFSPKIICDTPMFMVTAKKLAKNLVMRRGTMLHGSTLLFDCAEHLRQQKEAGE